MASWYTSLYLYYYLLKRTRQNQILLSTFFKHKTRVYVCIDYLHKLCKQIIFITKYCNMFHDVFESTNIFDVFVCCYLLIRFFNQFNHLVEKLILTTVFCKEQKIQIWYREEWEKPLSFLIWQRPFQHVFSRLLNPKWSIRPFH